MQNAAPLYCTIKKIQRFEDRVIWRVYGRFSRTITRDYAVFFTWEGYIFVATYCFVFEVWALATPTAQVRSGCVTCAHLITRSSAFRAKERTVHIQKLQELFMNYHELQYVSFWGRHCSITNPDSFVRIELATNLVLFSLPSHPTHTLLFLICNLSYTQHP